jgi:hypothetical protein
MNQRCNREGVFREHVGKTVNNLTELSLLKQFFLNNVEKHSVYHTDFECKVNYISLDLQSLLIHCLGIAWFPPFSISLHFKLLSEADFSEWCTSFFQRGNKTIEFGLLFFQFLHKE